MQKSGVGGGFSLLEVVLALAVFAVAATVMIRGMAHSLTWFQEAEQRLQAAGLIPAMDAVLLDQIRTAATGTEGPQASSGGGDGTWEFVALSDGSRIVRSGNPDGIPPAQQFFRIEVREADERVIPAGTDPQAVWVLEVTLHWPFRVPAGNASGYREVQAPSQNQLCYWSAVRP